MIVQTIKLRNGTTLRFETEDRDMIFRGISPKSNIASWHEAKYKYGNDELVYNARLLVTEDSLKRVFYVNGYHVRGFKHGTHKPIYEAFESCIVVDYDDAFALVKSKEPSDELVFRIQQRPVLECTADDQ